MTESRDGTPRASQVGWLIVLVASALLLAYGVMLFFVGPDMALENIAERTSLAPDDFRQGGAFDVITIVARQGAAFTAGLGLMALVTSWHGLRTGSAWAWWAAWAVPVAIAVFGAGFLPGAAQGYMFIGFAGVVVIGLLLARPRTAT